MNRSELVSSFCQIRVVSSEQGFIFGGHAGVWAGGRVHFPVSFVLPLRAWHATQTLPIHLHEGK